MLLPVFCRSVWVAATALALVASPASAQMFSEGHNFLEAVRDRDGDKVTEVVSKPGNILINTRDIATGDTALHIVTADGDNKWVLFLTQKGANPNIANKKGVTPVMLAVSLGNIVAAEALLKAGARIDDQNSLGETLLISATHRRDVQMVKLLLANGADPDRTDNSGRSARDYITAMDNKRLIAELAAADESGKGRQGPSYGPGI